MYQIGADLEKKNRRQTKAKLTADPAVSGESSQSERVEEAARESDLRIRSLFENMLDGYAYCRMEYDQNRYPVDFVYLNVNAAFERLTGLKDVVGKRVTEVIPRIRELEPELFETYGRVVSTGRPERFEINFKPLNIWLAIAVYSPQKDHFVAVFDNITGRKQAEKELRDSEHRYRQLVQSSPDAIIVHRDGQFLYANAAALSLYGAVALWQLKERNVLDLIHEDDSDAVRERMQLLEKGEKLSIRETRLITLDGREICVEAYASRVTYINDKAIQVIIRDITARKKAEAALRESEARLKRAQQIAHLGSWELDLRTNQLIWSDEVYRIFGLQPQEFGATYEAFLDYVHPDDRAAVDAAYSGSVRDGVDSYEIEHRVIRKGTGEMRYVQEKCQHVRDVDGNIILSLGMVHDITERKQAEEGLRQLNMELERLVEQRTGEATTMAAQLRELASELTLAEQRERQRIAKVLHDHIQQLLVAAKLQIAALVNRQQNYEQKASARLVNDLIDQTIAASRSLTAELSPPVLYDAGLGPALQWLARSFFEKHRLEVEVAFSPSAEPRGEDLRVFMFDAIREALFNVVKHSGVQRAYVECYRGEDERLRVVVGDKGKGFDSAQIQDRNKIRGYGLFSIQQRLKHMGGWVEIESTDGNGTRITLVGPPPLEARSAARHFSHDGQIAGTAVPQSSNGKIRVVLADDHHIIRQGLAGLLRSEPDIEIVGEASNGAQAVNLARSLQPEVVVMDLSMPVMNGVEATAEIRRDMPAIKVIGLSMHEEGEMSSAITQAGAVAYVTKGGSPEALLAAIRKAVGTRRVVAGI